MSLFIELYYKSTKTPFFVSVSKIIIDGHNYSKFYEEYDQEWMKYISEDILGYLNKHMSNKFIGYYAAQDADSEGEEGKYYIWEFNELKDKLSNNDLKMATKVFSLSKKGNFENKNILTKGLVDIYENGGIQENVDEFNNLFKYKK